jgi:protein involved in polysaccharide export with SLBB domain
LADRPKDGHVRRVFRIEGFDTNSDTETASVKWPEIVLSPGDVVQLEVVDLGEHFLRPVWRRHPSLIPDSMRGERL